MRRFLLCCTAMGLIAFGAEAQIIIGNGLGKDCYEAAKFSSGPVSAQERTCTEAIQSGTLTRRNLTATYVNRGIIRMRAKDFERAQEDYNAARKLRPDYGTIYLNEGAAMIGAGHPADAIPVLLKSLELETQDPHVAYFNLGLAYDMNNQLTEAYYAFQDALELKPEWELALAQLERYTVVPEG